MSTSSRTRKDEEGGRWRSHRWAAWLLRVSIFLAPMVAAVATSLWIAPRLFAPEGALQVIGWWLALVTASSLVAWVVDRMARRLLPLTVMMKMTLLFPDRAPSRFRVALRKSDLGELRRRVAAAESNGDRDEVAALMLSLAGALNRYDRRLRGHGERTRAYADMLAEEMKIPADARDKLRWAALLHDIGKIEIPVEILGKDGPLDASEKAMVRRHPLMGMRVAAPLVPWLGEWSRAIEDHHERWDGSGYPRGLKGEEIALGARIVAVADTFDVMTSGRSYQPAQSADAARREIARMAGTQFDPAVVRALMSLSLGKLRWMIGPVAWMGQIPFFLDRLGRDFITVTSAAVVTAASVVGAVAGPATGDDSGTLAMAAPTTSVVTTVPSADPDSPVTTSARSGDTRTSRSPVPELTAAAQDDDPADDEPTSTSAPITTSPPGDTGPGTTPDTTRDPTPETTTSTTLPPPSAHDDVASTEEDRAVTIDVVANDSGSMRLTAITSAPSRGAASLSAGRVRYVPEPDANGTDTFEYRACDGAGRCDTATVAVRVAPMNDPPTARDDSASTRSGQSVTIAVLDNDRDIDGDELRVGSVGSPSNGQAVTNGSTVAYTAGGSFAGTVSFSYQACDPAGACHSATVTVVVEAVPRPPNATDDTAYYHPGGREGSLDVLANDTHPDGLPLRAISIVQHPTKGEITSVSGGTVRYRMDRGTTTADSFVYRVCDSRGLCDTATVTLLKGP